MAGGPVRQTGTRADGTLFHTLHASPAAQATAVSTLYAVAALFLMPMAGLSALYIAATALLGTTLVALTVIDLQSFRLPDLLTLPLAGAGLLLIALTEGPLAWHLASAIIGFIALYGISLGYRHLRGRDGLGLGDAKLLAAAGAWLGAEALPPVVLVAALAAILVVTAARFAGRALSAGDAIPFGPFLALGIWIAWVYGAF